MQVTVALDHEQWQHVLNLLGRARFNRVAPLYLAIQRQIIQQPPQPEAPPPTVRPNGQDETTTAH